MSTKHYLTTIKQNKPPNVLPKPVCVENKVDVIQELRNNKRAAVLAALSY
ncbi:hypothetical protein BH10ACI2_BH10ACI2_13220 [soil metagenome]